MKNKILSVILMTTLIVLTLTVSASALSFTATMTPSATTVPESTEFTITVKVSNLDVGTNGINGLTGYLKYDTDVFETISESSIEGLNSWTPKFDETTGKISLTKSNFVTSTQEVFQITLKTKDGVSGKSGNVSFANISASNSETSITATDISTSITVGTSSNNNDTSNSTSNITVISANTSANNTSNNNTLNSVNTISANTASNNIVNNTTNNVTSNTSNNTISSYVNTMTNTTSNEDMPKTGVNDTILKLMFAVIAIAIVFYIKIEKLNKDMK